MRTLRTGRIGSFLRQCVFAIASAVAALFLIQGPRASEASRLPGSVTIFLHVGQATKRLNVRVADRIVCRGGGSWVATRVPRPYPRTRAWAVAYSPTLVVSVSSPLHGSVQMSCMHR
jgi:hypothetical protein